MRHGSISNLSDASPTGISTRVKVACDGCHAKKLKCTGHRPCEPCKKANRACHLTRGPFSGDSGTDAPETRDDSETMDLQTEASPILDVVDLPATSNPIFDSAPRSSSSAMAVPNIMSGGADMELDASIAPAPFPVQSNRETVEGPIGVKIMHPPSVDSSTTQYARANVPDISNVKARDFTMSQRDMLDQEISLKQNSEPAIDPGNYDGLASNHSIWDLFDDTSTFSFEANVLIPYPILHED